MYSSNVTYNAYNTTEFGPADERHFDFTPLFQDTLLSILPSALLLIAIPTRLIYLRKQNRKVLKSTLHESKIVSRLPN